MKDSDGTARKSSPVSPKTLLHSGQISCEEYKLHLSNLAEDTSGLPPTVVNKPDKTEMEVDKGNASITDDITVRSEKSITMSDEEIEKLNVGEYILVRAGDDNKFKFPPKILKVTQDDGEVVFEIVYFKYLKTEGESFHQQDCTNTCVAADIIKKLQAPTEYKITS